jgi:hypothetical protein
MLLLAFSDLDDLAHAKGRDFEASGDITLTCAALVLHADYEVWCMQTGLTSVSAEAFRDEFDNVREIPELAGNIRKQGNRYFGITLVDTNASRLPVYNRG